jgi:hypothetical protein
LPVRLSTGNMLDNRRQDLFRLLFNFADHQWDWLSIRIGGIPPGYNLADQRRLFREKSGCILQCNSSAGINTIQLGQEINDLAGEQIRRDRAEVNLSMSYFQGAGLVVGQKLCQIWHVLPSFQA